MLRVLQIKTDKHVSSISNMILSDNNMQKKFLKKQYAETMHNDVVHNSTKLYK